MRRVWRLFEIGASLHAVEWFLIGAVLPYAVLACTPDALRTVLVRNAVTQLAIFLPLVQLPVLLSGKMAYVDIGWPIGLVALAMNAAASGGWWVRRTIVGCVVGLHGGRMALGALALFGSMTNYTYRFTADLPRYRFARVRWESGAHAMPARTWWIKAQHDTLQQCLANSVLLALPVLLAASNPDPRLAPLELLGWAIWAAAWALENVADVQKLAFVQTQKRARRALAPDASPDAIAALKSACLGVAPHDGGSSRSACVWTWCRHPNYFGEWSCWFGIVIAALPSLLSLDLDSAALTAAVDSAAASGESLSLRIALRRVVPLRAVLGLALVYVLRMMYDCLVYWTGAAPAEHFSEKKRPMYRRYQRDTNCFWPKQLGGLVRCVTCLCGGVAHHRVPGWPDAVAASAHLDRLRFVAVYRDEVLESTTTIMVDDIATVEEIAAAVRAKAGAGAAARVVELRGAEPAERFTAQMGMPLARGSGVIVVLR